MLELTGVSRTYDDGHPVHALRPTNLHIAPNDYVTITGPSGSGKSTLLNILGLLDAPSNGSYRINDVEMTGLRETTRGAARGQLFGFVFQAFHLLSGRTVVENVELGMLYGPQTRRERRRRAEEVLERVGLSHRATADPRTLSGGERQRVAIARAVAYRPRVLFCDEPTGNLDSANTTTVLELLRELHTEGQAVIVVTHEANVAAQGARRLRVDDGVVSEE
ncbi:ABC transporter ATP-binding protein [Micromonospora sp. NPDC047527]|uniref:ABC transporter ATP-binding protein n=1 Tax=unclassified Micromonospora TaxID=2617518 RepID=UPI0033C7A8F4